MTLTGTSTTAYYYHGRRVKGSGAQFSEMSDVCLQKQSSSGLTLMLIVLHQVMLQLTVQNIRDIRFQICNHWPHHSIQSSPRELVGYYRFPWQVMEALL